MKLSIRRALITASACAALAAYALPASAQSADADAGAEASPPEPTTPDPDANTDAQAQPAAAQTNSANAERSDEDVEEPAENAEGPAENVEPPAKPTQDAPNDQPVVPADAAPAPMVATPLPVDSHPEPSVFVVGNQTGDAAHPWRVGTTGYLRTQYTAIEDHPDTEYGRYDGFAMADARVGFVGQSDSGFGFEIEIDAGTARPSGDANDPVGEVVTRLTDGYLFYEAHPLLRVSAGQFKPPFDLEELISTSSIAFVERSVGSRGVQNIEGANRDGLSRTREVGLRVDSRPFFFTADQPTQPRGVGVSYGLAVTNGQTANRTLNDNDQLAYTGRINLHWADLLQVGGGAYLNDRTLGQAPDQIGESRFGWTVDLLAQKWGATLFASLINTTIEPDLQAEAARDAVAFQAQISYLDPWIGLGPSYRYAHYDGDVDREGIQALETLTYHTIGLQAAPHDYPVRLLLNYTLTEEEVGELENNRFDALVQLTW